MAGTLWGQGQDARHLGRGTGKMERALGWEIWSLAISGKASPATSPTERGRPRPHSRSFARSAISRAPLFRKGHPAARAISTTAGGGRAPLGAPASLERAKVLRTSVKKSRLRQTCSAPPSERRSNGAEHRIPHRQLCPGRAGGRGLEKSRTSRQGRRRESRQLTALQKHYIAQDPAVIHRRSRR